MGAATASEPPSPNAEVLQPRPYFSRPANIEDTGAKNRKETEGAATLLQALLERVLEVAGESLRFKTLEGSWFRFGYLGRTLQPTDLNIEAALP